ncbi:MAG: hypothetical protein AAF441_10765 [Pseudomonadota bacterium]
MTALFDLNPFSVLGLFVGLLMGLAIVAFISRFGHAKIRDRHEQAKAHGRRAPAPSTVMGLAKLFAFFVLPTLGLVLFNVLAGTVES